MDFTDFDCLSNTDINKEQQCSFRAELPEVSRTCYSFHKLPIGICGQYIIGMCTTIVPVLPQRVK